ncbi:hypothetical protein Vadar_010255 [Vaccinium darrowii]|uniref:Uncharacterized protein n=1 Tax=Vaccinium darrowii TaxID=229202 RepID=A0ACB7XQ08_9ERIC|nr:hypothetical protein Vadar_010255 [Vaccinium darrowii]
MISAATLPLVLGLDHAFQVWQILKHRFNSVSKAHIHDLKQQLFNITKTITFDAYFDTIKELSYKLAAAGAPLSNDDLIFHALHGLPPEFDNLQTALSPRIGDLTFEELVTSVNGEEMRKNRAGKSVSGLPSSSVFLAVNKPDSTAAGSPSYSPSLPYQASASSAQRPPIPQAHMLQTSYAFPVPGHANNGPGLLPLPANCPNYSVPSVYSTSIYPPYSSYPTTSQTFPSPSPSPPPGPTGVMVGNGHTVPVAHSGQAHQSDFASRPFSPGAVSNSGLF